MTKRRLGLLGPQHPAVNVMNDDEKMAQIFCCLCSLVLVNYNLESLTLKFTSDEINLLERIHEITRVSKIFLGNLLQNLI